MELCKLRLNQMRMAIRPVQVNKTNRHGNKYETGEVRYTVLTIFIATMC